MSAYSLRNYYVIFRNLFVSCFQNQDPESVRYSGRADARSQVSYPNHYTTRLHRMILEIVEKFLFPCS